MGSARALTQPRDLAIGEQRVGVVLVVDHAVEHQRVLLHHLRDRGQEPGRQAVGVEAYRQAQRTVPGSGVKGAFGFALDEPQLAKVGEQAPAGRRRLNRLAAHTARPGRIPTRAA